MADSVTSPSKVHPGDALTISRCYLGVAAANRAAVGRPWIDFAAVNQAALRRLPDLLARWLPDGRRQGGEWVARNPRRNDRRPGSFKINMRTGLWADFATGDKGGDVVSLAAYLFGLAQAQAARQIADMLGISTGEGGRG